MTKIILARQLVGIGQNIMFKECGTYYESCMYPKILLRDLTVTQHNLNTICWLVQKQKILSRQLISVRIVFPDFNNSCNKKRLLIQQYVTATQRDKSKIYPQNLNLFKERVKKGSVDLNFLYFFQNIDYLEVVKVIVIVVLVRCR